MENKYKKGSEWRKWDLHIHTPLSIVQNYWWEDKFDDFIKWLEDLPKEIKVIWINDYYFIDWYKKVMKYKKDWKLKNIDKILPILEFRIDTFWSASESKFQKVNFHILFDIDEDNLDKEVKLIEEEFINQIKLSKHHDTKVLSKDNFISESSDNKLKTGFNEIIPSTEEVKKLLLTDTWKNKTFTFLWYVEWNNLNKSSQLKPEKEALYKIADAFFTASETDNISKKEEVLYWFWNKPLLHSGDIHDFKKLGEDYKCFTWIKADPTFEWLKQIIYEPEERVFIWEKPEVLDRIKNNKTKYIKSLKIDQVELYDEKKWIWFKNQEIELNKELVAIIWNKWNWKSAIADILGMLWNTENHEHFSFLNKKRFHKDWISKNFKWTICWEDNNKDSLILWNWVPENSAEKVRYLPQNFFNNLTNELETKNFTETLENVIFSHLDDSKSLGQTSFKDLKEYKSKIINENIEQIKTKIKELNIKIVKLERKKQKEELEKIVNKISEKENELKVQYDLLAELWKKEIKNPNEDEKMWDEKKKKFKEIEKINKEILELDKKIETEKNNKSSLEIDKQNLQDFLWYFENIEKQILDYKNENKETYEKLWLDINEIIKLNIKKEKVQDKLKIVIDKLEKLKYKFSEKLFFNLSQDEETKKIIIKNSLVIKKENKLEKIESIKKDLSKQEKEYQDYIQEIKNIQEKIKEIKWERKGEEDNYKSDTLEYYKNIKKYLSEKDKNWKTQLEYRLDELKNNRLKLSLEIYSSKKEIINLYKELKQPIDEKVDENKEYLEKESQINIDVKFLIKQTFNKNFLNFINQWKRWTFSWKIEWEQKLKEIYNFKNLNKKDDIKEILETFINYINFDKRDWEKNEEKNVFDQINELEEFYNYIFWLDYIDTEFELKSWKKSLEELSPWEKWTLLLIFYLMIDEEWIPLIIDQPEDNLDNQSVFSMLSVFIKKAKKKRQIIIITHNPNLAIWADAEQIIYVKIDKEKGNTFSFESWSIENNIMNNHIVDILEWTSKAFKKRGLKYID